MSGLFFDPLISLCKRKGIQIYKERELNSFSDLLNNQLSPSSVSALILRKLLLSPSSPSFAMFCRTHGCLFSEWKEISALEISSMAALVLSCAVFKSTFSLLFTFLRNKTGFHFKMEMKYIMKLKIRKRQYLYMHAHNIHAHRHIDADTKK